MRAIATMPELLVVAALVLSAVFAVAGLAKLFDRTGARSAAQSFGIPERLSGAVGVALPLAELMVAGLLVSTSTRWWGGVAALGLLLLFCGAIGVALARGDRPDCHCFGQLHSEPIGPGTLVRNGVLAVLALALVAAGPGDPGPSLFAWSAPLDATAWVGFGLGVALAVGIGIGAYAVVHVMRSYGRVLVRLEQVEERLRLVGLGLDDQDDVPELGLAPGTPAPAFWLPDTEGDRVALGDLLARGRPLLLLFSSPACGPCNALMPDVARWQRERSDDLTIAVLSDGELDLVRAEVAEHALVHVLLDERRSVYEAYQANGTPSAVLLSDDGTVASWLAAGADWIETLVEETLAGGGHDTGLPIGAVVPELAVELLGQGPSSLSDLIDRPTVLLFWNPSCGFCRSMHDDVLAWEQARPPEARQLVVVSAGDEDEVRAEGFAAAVLLDRKWALADALGADGTPMALLVDADGRVASRLATGAPAVLELLGAGAPSAVG
jgi:thiol-disulfide isomerase/thioredoxin